MASMLPGLFFGAAKAIAEMEAANAAKSLVDGQRARLALEKVGRDKSVEICGG